MSALIINKNTTALGFGVKSPFRASGGVAPYTYSIKSDGAAGVIEANGDYTAPLKPQDGLCREIIIATDNIGTIAECAVAIMSPLGLLCDIIQRELGLVSGQVYLWDQKLFLPTDSKLYVAIGIISLRPFANTNKMDANGNSNQSVNIQAALSVNTLSRSRDAVERKEEVIMALYSDYSKRQQSANSFHVARQTSTYVNLSEEDASDIPYRFETSVNVQYSVIKIKPEVYYDNFPGFTVETNE